jgi:hypothetical protein
VEKTVIPGSAKTLGQYVEHEQIKEMLTCYDPCPGLPRFGMEDGGKACSAAKLFSSFPRRRESRSTANTWKKPDLTFDALQVRSDGKITFPLLDDQFRKLESIH